jgi:hypothetical protein
MPKPQVSVTSTAADQPTDREADSRCPQPSTTQDKQVRRSIYKRQLEEPKIVEIQPDSMTSSAAAAAFVPSRDAAGTKHLPT